MGKRLKNKAKVRKRTLTKKEIDQIEFFIIDLGRALERRRVMDIIHRATRRAIRKVGGKKKWREEIEKLANELADDPEFKKLCDES